jgi:ABC-type Fe3+ transport system permease subunit
MNCFACLPSHLQSCSSAYTSLCMCLMCVCVCVCVCVREREREREREHTMEVRGQFCRTLHPITRVCQACAASAWIHFISYFPVAVIKPFWAYGFMGMRVHHHPSRETWHQVGRIVGTAEHSHHQHQEPNWNGTSLKLSKPILQ